MVWLLPTITKNLFSKPATRKYPFKDVRDPVPGYHGKIIVDPDKCDLCSDCARICPAKAIEVSLDNQTWAYDAFKCIYCGSCAETCLENALKQSPIYTPPANTKSVETVNIKFKLKKPICNLPKYKSCEK